MTSERTYWFPAKSYGWGWGIPSTWQGWGVLAGYVGAVAGSLKRFGEDSPAAFGVVGIATAALLGVCALKGEPPSWRWGTRPRR